MYVCTRVRVLVRSEFRFEQRITIHATKASPLHMSNIDMFVCGKKSEGKLLKTINNAREVLSYLVVLFLVMFVCRRRIPLVLNERLEI